MDIIKYDEDGAAYRLLSIVGDLRGKSWCVVEDMYEDEDSGDWYGEPRLISQKLYDSPPTQKVEAVIAALQEKVESLRHERDRIKHELNELEQVYDDRKKRYSQHEALKRLDDFLDGKLTYFAILPEHGIDRVRVATVDELNKSDDKFSNDTRLLSLFGRSKGDLAWNLNRWYDGSGRWQEIVPCVSYEDAAEVCRSYVAGLISDTSLRANAATAKAADNYGVPVPDEYRKAVEIAKRESATNAVKELEGKLLDAKEKLAAI